MEDKLKIYELPEEFGKTLTEEDIRNIVSNSLVNFKDTARVQKGYWQSDGFVSGSTGWRIDALGNCEFASGKFRGDITGATGTFSGAISAATIDIGGADTTSFHVDVNGNMWMGAALFADGVLKVTSAGALTATGVTITGSLTTGLGSSINGTYITTASITGTAIANATITATQIANATITGTQIAATTIQAGNIANGTITTTQISGTAGIVGGQIASATLTGGNIAATTITGANITNLTITASQIANLTITSGKVNTALMSYSHNIVFSVASDVQVNWASGTLTTSDGTTYTISDGNTGTMSAKNYIYLDTAVSLTVLQKTTTFSTAVGDGKMLIAVAQNNTTEAVFQVFNGIGGTNLAGGNIVAGSITANEIAANTITASQIAATTITASQIAANTITASQIASGTITATQIASSTITATQIAASTITSDKLSVSTLSAISADLGSITAGTIVMPSGGFIRSGQTAFNTGTGFYLGNDSGTQKFSIGNSTGKRLTWDGTVLNIKGDITVDSLTWGRLTGITNFETLDGFSTKGVGSSVFTPYFLGTFIQSGGTNNNYAVLYANPVGMGGGISIASFKNPTMAVVCRIYDGDYAEAFIGIGNVAGWPLSNAADDNYIGFSLKSNSIKAVSRKTGTATNSTTITGYPDVYHNYRFEVTANGSGVVSQVKFYLDGVLVATHTTNLPDLIEEGDIFMGVKNWNNGGQQGMSLINLLYIQDF
jgi:hypothetical protein